MTLTWIVSIAIGMIGISIMVIVHELGHMIAAKACGITVEALQFGFGPVIYRWGKKETQYRIAIIPFGGMCKMSGQQDLQNAINRKQDHIDSCEEGSIWSVGPIKRFITYFAGPLANMLFAFVCYAMLLSLPVLQSISESRIVVSSDYPTLYNIETCSAYEGGLRTGDYVIAVDNKPISSYEELLVTLGEVKYNKEVTFTTNRGNFIVEPKDGLFGILPYKEAIVGHVTFGSIEKTSGLKPKDKIINANGIKITNMFDLIVAAKSDSKMTMTVQRGNKIIIISYDNPEGSLNFSLLQKDIYTEGTPFFKALVYSAKECFKNFGESVLSLSQVISG
ncbi:MAG: RIP metalloprotease RseP, partial [Sphaerochaetaceae bacterium]|nr:RIP metalloprotease RseP [Sphaerochaetaceae bacterium]